MTCQFRSVRGTWRAFIQGATWSVLEEPGFFLQWFFSLDLVEEGEDGVPEALRVPSCLTWMLLQTFLSLLHASECACWKKTKQKPHRFLAWASSESLCREKSGMPWNWECGRELRPNCSQQGYVTDAQSYQDPGDAQSPALRAVWRSHRLGPAGKRTQCVCLRVVYAEGTVRWGSASSIPTPARPSLPATLRPLPQSPSWWIFNLNYFWTVLLFAVFSSKFVIKGPTWHWKCSCGLIPVQSNWIWARKKLLTHFRGEALVFVLLPPSGRVKAEWPLWLSLSHRTTQDSEENGFCGALAMRHFFLCKPHSPQHREGGIITPVLQMWLREEKNISMGKWVAPWHLLFQPLCLKKCMLWRRIRCYSILFCVFRKNPFLSRLPFMLL